VVVWWCGGVVVWWVWGCGGVVGVGVCGGVGGGVPFGRNVIEFDAIVISHFLTLFLRNDSVVLLVTIIANQYYLYIVTGMFTNILKIFGNAIKGQGLGNIVHQDDAFGTPALK
jgi:hypothetical protein